MDTRRFLLGVALIYAALTVGFALRGNAAQAVVAGLASLVAFGLLWWYSTRAERDGR